MAATPRKYAVDLTLDQVLELRTLIRDKFTNEGYYVKPDEELLDEYETDDDGNVVTNDDGEPLVKRNRRWEREEKPKAIERRVKLNALHVAITGDDIAG